MKTLLIYATAHGSTAEVARYISNILKERGLDISITDIKDVNHLEGYDAFIFGTAIHNGAWLQDMTLLLRHELQKLKDVPVYLFMTCMRVMEPYGLDHVMEFYVKPDILNELNIRDKAAFAGKLDLETIDWNERWTLAARYDGTTWPSSFDGDFRNWEKINQWASQVGDDLEKLKAIKSDAKSAT